MPSTYVIWILSTTVGEFTMLGKLYYKINNKPFYGHVFFFRKECKISDKKTVLPLQKRNLTEKDVKCYIYVNEHERLSNITLRHKLK